MLMEPLLTTSSDKSPPSKGPAVGLLQPVKLPPRHNKVSRAQVDSSNPLVLFEPGDSLPNKEGLQAAATIGSTGRETLILENHHSKPAVLEEGQVGGKVQELGHVVEKTNRDSVASETHQKNANADGYPMEIDVQPFAIITLQTTVDAKGGEKLREKQLADCQLADVMQHLEHGVLPLDENLSLLSKMGCCSTLKQIKHYVLFYLVLHESRCSTHFIVEGLEVTFKELNFTARSVVTIGGLRCGVTLSSGAGPVSVLPVGLKKQLMLHLPPQSESKVACGKEDSDLETQDEDTLA